MGCSIEQLSEELKIKLKIGNKMDLSQVQALISAALAAQQKQFDIKINDVTGAAFSAQQRQFDTKLNEVTERLGQIKKKNRSQAVRTSTNR